MENGMDFILSSGGLGLMEQQRFNRVEDGPMDPKWSNPMVFPLTYLGYFFEILTWIVEENALPKVRQLGHYDYDVTLNLLLLFLIL